MIDRDPGPDRRSGSRGCAAAAATSVLAAVPSNSPAQAQPKNQQAGSGIFNAKVLTRDLAGSLPVVFAFKDNVQVAKSISRQITFGTPKDAKRTGQCPRQ
ncbi:hypothetical protein OK351_07130 [Glutamicibacter sp. MNS18]|uniref:hypothetical protein n=1 Tax=Glutamicibacter sp. MNS18 TaxID=2989817 RepID=UPI0022357975|nr:hypothetical protein [Glutamicibacter sp. MNS18]MCW4465272.1 hypothetical protein [Glutamicibacter sp. MNS18]